MSSVTNSCDFVVQKYFVKKRKFFFAQYASKLRKKKKNAVEWKYYSLSKYFKIVSYDTRYYVGFCIRYSYYKKIFKFVNTTKGEGIWTPSSNGHLNKLRPTNPLIIPKDLF
jgi:hypothetical protein